MRKITRSLLEKSPNQKQTESTVVLFENQTLSNGKTNNNLYSFNSLLRHVRVRKMCWRNESLLHRSWRDPTQQIQCRSRLKSNKNHEKKLSFYPQSVERNNEQEDLILCRWFPNFELHRMVVELQQLQSAARQNQLSLNKSWHDLNNYCLKTTLSLT